MNNNNENTQELELIHLEDILIIVFIISLIISLLLNYNYTLQKTNRHTFWTNDEAKHIAISNAVMVVLAAFGELYIVLRDREIITKSNGTPKQIELSDLNIFIGIVAVVISFLELYIIHMEVEE